MCPAGRDGAIPEFQCGSNQQLSEGWPKVFQTSAASLPVRADAAAQWPIDLGGVAAAAEVWLPAVWCGRQSG